MSSRGDILARIRANQPPPVALPDVPLFDDDLPPPWPRFVAGLTRMGGKLAELQAGETVADLVARIHPDARSICSQVPEVPGTVTADPAAAPAQLHGLDVGIVRSPFGVAETGSIFLTEAELGVIALGYLAEHLVVLLDPGQIVGTLHNAYAHPRFRESAYMVFMSGPSATADIEGVLIHGAQGVRSLTVVPLPPA